MAAVNPNPKPVAEDDAFVAAIRAAQAEIENAVERGGLRKDALRYPLLAISTALGVFPDLVARMDAAAARVQPPPPPPGKDVIDAIARAVTQIVWRIRPAIERRTQVIIIGMALGAALVGAGAGFATAYFTRGPDHVAVCWQQGGQQMCGPAVWLQTK
jgi:hypothetical protein